MKNIVFLLLILLSYSGNGQSQKQDLSGVYHWDKLSVENSEGLEIRTFIEGPSTHFEFLKIYAITQKDGIETHHKQIHEDKEEVIIIREGSMKVTIDGEPTILGPHSVIQLMPGQIHSLERVGENPLSYYVMEYKSRNPVNMERGLSNGGTLLINADSLIFKRSARGAGRAYFDRATAMCERFEMHVTQLNLKGPSHTPHFHDETEIILILTGENEMTIDGKEYSGVAGDFYLMDSNMEHGVRNPLDESCSYFAFKWK